MAKYAPASSIADLNQQTEQKSNGQIGGNIGGGSSGDFSVQMNGNNQNQQDLISKVAKHCGCPIDIARQALEASQWNPQNAVTRIETLKSQRNSAQ